MSNLALENYLSYIGISTIRTKVGDRNVLEAMKNNKCNFGGEQSGHIILGDYSNTGDGLVAALQILSALYDSKKKVSELADLFPLMPQILKNIRFDQAKSKNNPLENQQILDFIKQEEEKLGENSRIFIRKSGTEPLIRILVEGDNENLIEEVANNIAEKILSI